MKWYFLLLLFIYLPLTAQQSDTEAEVYRTTKKGVTRYSDTGSDDAALITLPKTTVIEAPPKFPQPPAVAANNETTQSNYSIAILAPKDQQTIRSNPGTINVNLEITPTNIGTNIVQPVLNGEKFAPQSTLIFQLQNIPRGQHSFFVEMADKTGKVIAKSDPVTFYLFRQSIITPK